MPSLFRHALTTLLALAFLATAAAEPPATATPPAAAPAPYGGFTIPPELRPWMPQLEAAATAQLTAALNHAYATHIQQSRPLPEAVREFLRGLLPDEVLNGARYTVSADEITLPGLLNHGNRELLGQDHAVSIENLIIFSREPTFERPGDARWWAHELGHHVQYRRLGGVAGFAAEYVRNFQGLEQEAESYGVRATQKYLQTHPGEGGRAAP